MWKSDWDIAHDKDRVLMAQELPYIYINVRAKFDTYYQILIRECVYAYICVRGACVEK